MFLPVDVGIFSRHFSKKVVVLIENFLSTKHFITKLGFAENVFKKFSLYIMKELDTWILQKKTKNKIYFCKFDHKKKQSMFVVDSSFIANR